MDLFLFSSLYERYGITVLILSVEFLNENISKIRHL